MLSGPTLETARLRLRPYRIEDFETYAGIFAEPEVVRYLGGQPLSRETAWTRFLRQLGLWSTLGFGSFAVVSKDNGRLIGSAGFHDLKRQIVPSLEGTMEAGWVFAPSAHGRGFGEEAMTAAIAWADAERPQFRQTCIIHPENARSLRLAGRLGFAEIGRSIYGDGAVVVLERHGRRI